MSDCFFISVQKYGKAQYNLDRSLFDKYNDKDNDNDNDNDNVNDNDK